MTIGLKSRYLLISAVLFTVSACSSSNSDNPNSGNANDDPDPQGPLVPAEGPFSPPAAPGADPGDGTPEAPSDIPIDDPVQEPEPAPEPVPEPDPVVGQPVEPISLLVPPVIPGSDLDRLVQGLTQQVAVTLLDLNQLIFSTGQALLTTQQEACLGGFEEGLGFALTAIDCGELRLATGNNPMRVGIAEFYDTPECLNALLIQSSDGCVLQRLSLTVGADWDNSAGGPPALLFPGALLNYAIGDTSLHIDSDSEFLAGVFSCDIDLNTVDLTSEFAAADCDNTVKIVADQIEKMQSL